MIVEPKVVNAGAPQGAFLNRQMVLKQDGSKMPFVPEDFNVGLDIGICGRAIRIYDADDYTRQYFLVSAPIDNPSFNVTHDFFLQNIGRPQADAASCPEDSFAKSLKPVPPKKDPELLEYLEKKLGGGRVASQK